MKRFSVNKSKSSRRFGRDVRTQAAANMQMGPMRGGWRF